MRLQAMGTSGYANGFQLTILSDRLDTPLKRKKPTLYFVNSMSDLFHEDIPFSFIDLVMATIEQAHWHRFQILTKRAERMAAYFQCRRVPTNAWLGVSVEDQKYGLPRIEHLRHINATVRFLSIEPLLEDLGQIDLRNLHWVIVGGESGANARPIQLPWIESIQRQCERSEIVFFFKQWGRWGVDGKARSKKANGRLLHGRTFDDIPTLAIASQVRDIKF